ncbi:YafY family transcriptional regulator [Flavobacteriaceae bacterium TP-CH-4]|uniref:YafY family transcriptional regulator n=1 Tax=Pelagihabitans pacificus TaxID=2696054 RepID=A0A967ASP9_9FLAO|nr:YafY family protein [Pelagihabitans pacificus]NHF58525.1 YafY family transcriptional regulator [Pelagihabitans pacificus]
MSYSSNISRLSRLTSILLKLQSRPAVKVQQLANSFGVSKRTIYRDLTALEQVGVPIVSLEGEGYTLMEGYVIPPVMFTESEANALIFGKKMIDKTKDESLIREFNSAIDKIKAVLRTSEKEKADFLAHRTIIGKNWQDETTSTFLAEIQKALTNFLVIEIHYKKAGEKKISARDIEPFAIYHNMEENWVVIAWCRLRNEYRNFRLDRIQKLTLKDEHFPPHKMTMQEYEKTQRDNHFNVPATKG